MPQTKEEAELEYERLRMGKLKLDGTESDSRPLRRTSGKSTETASDATPVTEDGSGLDGDEKTEAEVLDATISAERAKELKSEGNVHFQSGKYQEAIECYTSAARSAHASAEDRAVYYQNRAAARLRLEEYDGAVADATEALRLNPEYAKARTRQNEARMRRSAAREAKEDFAGALEDAKESGMPHGKVLELQRKAKEKQEKQQAEAIEQLKGLGNSLLSNFGLSLDNFKVEKDPGTGSYNIQMKQ